MTQVTLDSDNFCFVDPKKIAHITMSTRVGLPVKSNWAHYLGKEGSSLITSKQTNKQTNTYLNI
jgi:hypothetical protein